MRRMTRIALVATASMVISGAALGRPMSPEAPAAPQHPCAVSKPVRAEPPRDPNADPFGMGPWFVNADRTIWTWATRLVSGDGGNKLLWIRPAGTTLEVSGRRLDGPSPPLTFSMPAVYPSGFQASGIVFPRAGCWEIRAKAGKSELVFITLVSQPASSAAPAEPRQ